MIILAMAIYCEAKPLIEKYRLKKDESYMPFTVFANEEKEISFVCSLEENIEEIDVKKLIEKEEKRLQDKIDQNTGKCSDIYRSRFEFYMN